METLTMNFGSKEESIIKSFPDTLVLYLFQYLTSSDLISASAVCRQWSRVVKDDFLWKRLFLSDFKLKPDTTLPGYVRILSWYSEYRRLIDETPCVLSEKLDAHKDEVLHVAFANNGSVFATSSKDATVKIWSCDYPCQILCEETFPEWNSAQYSEFNVDDTLFLVSGILPNRCYHVEGEIYIYEFHPGRLICLRRVKNKPYDVFGCWFNRDVFITGWLHSFFTQHLSSCSSLFLCNVTHALEPVKDQTRPPITKMLNFINFCASTIRAVQISDYVSDWVREAIIVSRTVRPLRLDQFGPFEINATIDELRDSTLFAQRISSYSSWTSSDCIPKTSTNHECHGGDRLLIFALGSECYTPHEIGFKLIKYDDVKSFLDNDCVRPLQPASPTNMEREIQFPNEPEPTMPNIANSTFILANFNLPDYVIDMRGHIVGFKLSKDKRYLFVNVRPWLLNNGHIVTPDNPLPPSERIELRVIELETLTLVDEKVYHGHKGFTPKGATFYLFLDSCDTYIASGSEDKFAHIWERHYGIPLGLLPHDGVVNTVAFNSKSNEMLVSVSDDNSVKVWRSRRVVRELKERLNGLEL